MLKLQSGTHTRMKECNLILQGSEVLVSCNKTGNIVHVYMHYSSSGVGYP